LSIIIENCFSSSSRFVLFHQCVLCLLVNKLAEQLKSTDGAQVLIAATEIRQLLQQKNPPVDHVVKTGMVPHLVRMLTCPKTPDTLLFEVGWILTNIAVEKEAHVRLLVRHKTIDAFMHCIKTSKSSDVFDQAMWGLGNIAGESAKYRDMVLATGVLPIIVTKLQAASAPSLATLRIGVWFLANLFRLSPNYDSISSAMPLLADLLINQQNRYNGDSEVNSEICWALASLTDNDHDNTKIQAILDMNVCTHVVKLLEHPSRQVQVPARRLVGNLASGTHDQTLQLLNTDVLACLLPFLTPSANPKAQISACFTLSNIVADDAECIQKVIDANLIPYVVRLMSTGALDAKAMTGRLDVASVQGNALYVVYNYVLTGTTAQIEYLVKQGVIPPLCALIKLSTVKLLRIVLDALAAILASGEREHRSDLAAANPHVLIARDSDGLAGLRTLLDHPSQDMIDSSSHILTIYFQ